MRVQAGGKNTLTCWDKFNLCELSLQLINYMRWNESSHPNLSLLTQTSQFEQAGGCILKYISLSVIQQDRLFSKQATYTSVAYNKNQIALQCVWNVNE
jgi:hypothetical protein